MKNSEIVITGGPCSGKTTGMNYLNEKLADKGFRSLVVPEVATMIILSGLRDINEIAKRSPEKILAIEESMFLTQLSLQKRYNELAAIFPEDRRVILYDRGIMDVAAYAGEDYFNFLLKKHGLNRVRARDSYDGVIHLRTVAIGAEKFYTTDNNKARRETLDEAAIADEKILSAWLGHPHLKVIDNSTDFEGKLKRTFQVVCRILGIPVPIEIERKYLLKARPDFHNPILKSAQKIFIEQMYLISDDPTKEVRIRKRSQNGSNMYYQTVKTRIDELERYETEFSITEKEYYNLALARDASKNIILKERHCFVYKEQYFELDIFISPSNLNILEIELTDRNEKVEIPKFLSVRREVTGDKQFTNFKIASN